jgi:hypothetical protein
VVARLDRGVTPVGRGRPFEVVLITIGRDGSSGRRRFAHLGQELAIVREGPFGSRWATTCTGWRPGTL